MSMDYNENSKNEKMKELKTKLEEGVKNVFTSDRYKEYLSLASKFHNYSYNNVMLILMQKPTATMVAGYKKWQDEFNRHVKKGEKALKIIAPMFKTEVVTKRDENGEPVLDDKGNTVKEKVQNLIGFKIVNVFDVSQTEGDPLPTLTDRLQGNVEDYEKIMNTLKKISPYPVVFTEFDGETNGLCSFKNRQIYIQANMSEQQTIKTLIHEITHAIFHEERDKNRSIEVKEIEAESVAFIVSDYLGIDTSSYSFSYIASWSEDKELTKLKESLDRIQKASQKIINAINENTQEMVNVKQVSNDLDLEIE